MKEIRESGILLSEISGVNQSNRDKKTYLVSETIRFNESNWFLTLNLKDNVTHVGIWLCRDDGDAETAKIDCKLTLLSTNTTNNKQFKCKETFKSGIDICGSDTLLKWNSLIDENEGYVVNEKIRIDAEITIVTEFTSGDKVWRSIKGPLFDAMNDDEDDKLCDVKIIVDDDNEYSTSKLLLAIHSPVFRAMFTSGMAESTLNEIRITDFNFETVRAMITFMYNPKYWEIYAATSTTCCKVFQSVKCSLYC